MSASVTVSAPGSIMITGEHAVVYGHPAIVCAIEQRITVNITQTNSGFLDIVSEIAPPIRQPLSELVPEGPMRFVLRAVSAYRHYIRSGLTIRITSQIDPTLGLGSSAAVTAATLAALNLACKTKRTAAQLHLEALAIIRQIQGRGSGADLAASLFGGTLSYRLPKPLLAGVPASKERFAQITALPDLPPLGLCYVGYKTPTSEVLETIARKMRGHESTYERLYAQMGESAAEAITAAQKRDWPRFAKTLTEYQAMLQQLGVSDPEIDRIIAGASTADAAKISGSGLGDCVLSLGALPPGFRPVQISNGGVLQHE